MTLFVCCMCTSAGAGARFARMCCCFASKPGWTFLFFNTRWTRVAASESAESSIYYLLQKAEPLMWLENKPFLIYWSLIVSPGCANVLISLFNCQWQVLPICFHLRRNLFEMRNCSKNRQNDNPACGFMGGNYDAGRRAAVMEKSWGGTVIA